MLDIYRSICSHWIESRRYLLLKNSSISAFMCAQNINLVDLNQTNSSITWKKNTRKELHLQQKSSKRSRSWWLKMLKYAVFVASIKENAPQISFYHLFSWLEINIDACEKLPFFIESCLFLVNFIRQISSSMRYYFDT